MTYYYKTYSWSNNSNPGITKETIDLWKHFVEKKNWRIVQLPNGFYQTEHLELESEDTWTPVTRRETI